MAQSDGIEAAYRPLLLAVLTQEFAVSVPQEQQRLLTDRRTDLLHDLSFAYLNQLAQEVQDNGKLAVALALLHLARTKSDVFLDAFAAPFYNAGPFVDLLHIVAREPGCRDRPQSGYCRP